MAATTPMFILFGLLLCVDVMVKCETSDGGAYLRPGVHRLSALAPRNARQSRIPVLFLSLRGGGKNPGTMTFQYPEGKGWEEDFSSTVAAVAAAWGKSCSGCGKRAPDGGNLSTSEKLLRCSWCRQAFYCGKECQLAHWPTHKKGCPPTAASAPQPNQGKNETTADPDRPSVRVRRRIAEAEDIKERASANKGKLPKDCMDWKICRSCRLPVIIEWLDCPGCERPISDLDDEDTRGLMPEQTRMVQHTKILGDPQQDLLHGAETNNIPLMESAVSAGANFSVCDPELYNSGALHYAAGQGHLEAVTWLVHRGMTVDMPNSCDESPLHWAAESGHSKVVEYLLSMGANISRLNTWREGPIDVASAAGYYDLVALLRQRGAKEQRIGYVGKPLSRTKVEEMEEEEFCERAKREAASASAHPKSAVEGEEGEAEEDGEEDREGKAEEEIWRKWREGDMGRGGAGEGGVSRSEGGRGGEVK